MRKLILLLMLVTIGWCSSAMTPKDSVQIVKANWSPKKIRPGVVHKHAPFKFLYGMPQNIHIIEVAPAGKRQSRLNLLVNEPPRTLSESARSVHAIAAINGSRFDKSNGKSLCFMKIGPDVIDTTSFGQLNGRATGALRIDKKGNINLIPWDRQIENSWAEQNSVVMVAGPLLIKDGEMCAFSQSDSVFIQERHPRSAIGITKDGSVLLVTADGYFPTHAVGMSIPELAYLMKMLGCKQALNLCGGAFTTMWVNHKDAVGVINMPSGNEVFDHSGEQPVANILYIR
ncbi:MAG: phosphodiester glycosidase family protein [Bacteroidales bacterium]